MSAPWAYTLQVPNDPRAVSVARATLRAVLRAHELLDIRDTTELLASELLTNAVRHSDGPASLRVGSLYDRLRVGVWDTNPVIPAPFGAVGVAGVAGGGSDPLADDGRGLQLVRRCADSYGGYALGEALFGAGGKLLWFEVGTSPRSG